MRHTPRSPRAAAPGWAVGLAAAALATAAALCAPPARAQAAPPAAACPGPTEIEPAQLYGLWQLRLWPEGGDEDTAPSRGALLFERHPEFPGSVRGELRRSLGGQEVSAQVSGDAIDGVFNLDESADGVTMSAVWSGEPGACGRSIRGTRRPAAGQPAGEPVLHFHLFRQPGWR